MKWDRYTLTYRATETRQVMNWIKAGQSGCLIGLRGGGKSNLLRFLLCEKVRQYYLGQDYANFAFILIDLLALTECTEWAVCELVLDRLLDQLCPLGIEEKIVEEMTLLQQEVMRSRDLLTAYRAVERCVDVLCRRTAQRAVLLFGEFDAVFRTLDPSLFRCLRAIRNAHKGQVSYVVAVANDLASLRDDLTQVEHFYWLVSRNVCILGPFGEADARHMIHYLASRRSAELGDKDTARVIELCGGHASLLKAILSLLWDAHHEGGLAELALALNDEPMVQAECRKIWESLSEGEQAALCALAGGMQADPDALRHLKRRGVVREDQLGTFIFSPLFAHFVHQQAPPLPIGTVISVSPRIVQISGRHIKNLTELEFEMLRYLYEHQDGVCTKNELAENVYGYGAGVTDEALQALISRLRDKIELDRSHPSLIVTVRGLGYRFVEPSEQ
jgi:hypothetical protein